MADEDAQARAPGEEESSWWALDASSDTARAAPSFDEPLEWPEATVWEDLGAQPSEAVSFGPAPDDAGHLDVDLLFPPADPGHQGPAADDEATQLRVEALPESIWAAGASPHDDELVAPGPVAAPTFYAEAERNAPGWSLRRLDAWHPKAPLVALVSFVGVALLATVLFLPRGNDRPTDASQSGRPTGDIAAQGPLDTAPLPTTTVTTAPPSISLSDLIPADDASGEPSGEGAAAGAGTSSKDTAAPARSAAPTASRGAGGGGGDSSGSGSAQQPAEPAESPTATEPAPEPTSPPSSSSPRGDITAGAPRRSAPTNQYSPPTYAVPTTTPWTMPTTRPSSVPRSSFSDYNDD